MIPPKVSPEPFIGNTIPVVSAALPPGPVIRLPVACAMLLPITSIRVLKLRRTLRAVVASSLLRVLLTPVLALLALRPVRSPLLDMVRLRPLLLPCPIRLLLLIALPRPAFFVPLLLLFLRWPGLIL